MQQRRIVRKYTRRVYDRYSAATFSATSDNLNPVNPTQLESQFDEMLTHIKGRVLNAYEKAHIKAPSDLFETEGSLDPQSLLNNLDDLMNALERSRNPLMDLADKDLPLSPFLTALDTASYIMDNPLRLDCEGIEKTLLKTGEDSTNGSEDDDDDGNNGGEGDDDDGGNGDIDDSNSYVDDGFGGPNGSLGEDGSGGRSYQITYIVSNGRNASNPATYKERDCPLTLQDAIADENYIFKGWYLDSSFSEKLPKNELSWLGKNVTLYALNELDNDDKDDDEDSGNSLQDPMGGDIADGDGCDLKELTWLKIILIILILIQVLIKVLVLVYNIMKAVADIAKDAQLCWINPPSLQSLISYVMQRLSAIIFQLIGMILLKIWAMLNLDCVVASVNDMVDQVNAVMSGIAQTMAKVDAAAMTFSGGTGLGSIGDMIRNMFNQVAEQFQKFQDAFSWNSIKNQLKESVDTICEDYRELFTNPELLYNTAVPQEIRDQVQSLKDSYDAMEGQIQGIRAAYDSMMGSIHKMQGEDMKGTLKKVLL